jgi:TRAP-type mannitol/chloroaromatic compound transport system substrate-binding protein
VLKQKISRRHILAAGAAGASTVLAAPAIAQTAPTLKWRMPSTFGRNLEALYGSGQVFIDTVRDLTDGRFTIQWYAPGEIVPAFSIVDAVQSNTVELGQTCSFYYTGKDPAFQFGSDLPFGMNATGHNAWVVNAGGKELLADFYKKFNIYGVYCGNTGAQMAGWFRKEIRSVADFRGLKMRIAGMAGDVLARAGGVPQQIPPGETYSALERGSIDGTKLIMPLDDEKLGLVRVAPYYYYPGWNDPGVGVHVFVNLDQWQGLPKAYQAALTAAGARAGEYLQTKYSVENPKALRRLVAQGAQIRSFPNDVINELWQAAKGLYADLSAQSPEFKKMYESYMGFSGEHYLWWQVAEYSFDSMVIRERARR